MASQADKVALYALIRRESRAGMSGRAIERKHRVSRRTVAKALASAWPEPRRELPRRPSLLDRFAGAIDEMLRADLGAPRKQRHTVTRIFSRLTGEFGAEGISCQTVRKYVARRRLELWAEAGRAGEGVRAAVAPARAEAEVDFGEVAVRLSVKVVSCSLFSLRLSYSGKAVHRVSGHGRAGGVPGKERARVRDAGRSPVRQDPLRQPRGGGRDLAGACPGHGRRFRGGPRSARTMASLN